MSNYFNELYQVDVSDHIEKKNDLSYVSWPFAWAELKKRFPMSYYTVYENAHGWNYHTDGKTCWVKTGVTVKWMSELRNDNPVWQEIEHIEYLPVMDYKNKSIPADQVTSFDVNKAIQRSLTKAVARHGLGLFVYGGEDLPEDMRKEAEEKKKANELLNKDKKKILDSCKAMGLEFTDILLQTGWKQGETLTREQTDKALVILQEISEERHAAKKSNRNPK